MPIVKLAAIFCGLALLTNVATAILGGHVMDMVNQFEQQDCCSRVDEIQQQIDELSDDVRNTEIANSKIIKQLQTRSSTNQQRSITNSNEIAINQESITSNDEDIAAIQRANNRIRKDIKQLNSKVNNIQVPSLPSSCNDVKTSQPNSPSGVYLISTPSGDSKYVYCQMDRSYCGDGGWTRVAYLDMSNTYEECPSQFKLYEASGTRACGRPVNQPGCISITFPTDGLRYSQVCGRVLGYQYASPDAVNPTIGTGHNDINSHYVDGISITHGSPNRKHIWTYMAGVTDDHANSYQCPCNTGSTTNVQSFIGDSYYCESAASKRWARQLYTDDLLWDGKQCDNLEEPCCQSDGMPWFYKALSGGTTDDIEFRVCADQSTSDEDVPVSLYEIYIK